MTILTAGIDVGGATTKAVVFCGDGRILGTGITKTGADIEKAARAAYSEALAAAGTSESEVSYLAATGYGRSAVSFRDGQMTELTAHAQGAFFLFPGTRSILDVGSQNTRAICIEHGGRVKNFRLNDKCAAGAGSFLNRVAQYLEVGLEDIGPLALKAREPVLISSICAVLAESEIINHLSAGQAIENILMGSMLAVATRAAPLLRRLGLEPEVTLTGGAALNPAMVRALEEKLGAPVNVDPERGLYAGAIGASVLAALRLKKLRAGGEDSAARSAAGAAT